MTDDKINAIVASAFNLAAAERPELRSSHPNGMRAADAAMLHHSVRLGWCESYADRMNRLTAAAREKALFLFTPAEVQEAIDALSDSGRVAQG